MPCVRRTARRHARGLRRGCAHGVRGSACAVEVNLLNVVDVTVTKYLILYSLLLVCYTLLSMCWRAAVQRSRRLVSCFLREGPLIRQPKLPSKHWNYMQRTGLG